MELLEQILAKENLNKAYKKVYQNKGVAGADGITVEEIAEYIKEHNIAQLFTKKYCIRQKYEKSVDSLQIHACFM